MCMVLGMLLFMYMVLKPLLMCRGLQLLLM